MLTLVIIELCAAPLFIFGLFIKKGKGLMFLSGYNTMPKEERANVDKEELSKLAGNMLLRMALAFALLGVAAYLALTWAAFALLFVFIADACISTIRIYRIMPMTTITKKGLGITVAITAIVLIASGGMIYYGEKEPTVRIADNSIQIKAMYGLEISLSEVTTIALIEKSMKDIGVGRRNNGYGGFGETLKGHFSSEDLEIFLLFVKSESSPTLWIERDGKEDIYISFGDGEKTKALYQELTAAVP